MSRAVSATRRWRRAASGKRSWVPRTGCKGRIRNSPIISRPTADGLHTLSQNVVCGQIAQGVAQHPSHRDKIANAPRAGDRASRDVDHGLRLLPESYEPAMLVDRYEDRMADLSFDMLREVALAGSILDQQHLT